MERDEDSAGLGAAKWSKTAKTVFTSLDKGFKLQEDRRRDERAFQFDQPPSKEIKSKLLECGLSYNSNTKRWTIPLTPSSRAVTDRLALEFSGKQHDNGIDR